MSTLGHDSHRRKLQSDGEKHYAWLQSLSGGSKSGKAEDGSKSGKASYSESKIDHKIDYTYRVGAGDSPGEIIIQAYLVLQLSILSFL